MDRNTETACAHARTHAHGTKKSHARTHAHTNTKIQWPSYMHMHSHTHTQARIHTRECSHLFHAIECERNLFPWICAGHAELHSHRKGKSICQIHAHAHVSSNARARTHKQKLKQAHAIFHAVRVRAACQSAQSRKCEVKHTHTLLIVDVQEASQIAQE